jgi:hypothetical protein
MERISSVSAHSAAAAIPAIAANFSGRLPRFVEVAENVNVARGLIAVMVRSQW